jgi:hypothetical protein
MVGGFWFLIIVDFCVRLQFLKGLNRSLNQEFCVISVKTVN